MASVCAHWQDRWVRGRGGGGEGGREGGGCRGSQPAQRAQPARRQSGVPESFSQASTYPRRLAWAGLNRELSRTAVHRLTSQGAELAPRQLGSAGGRERRHACQAAGGRASAAQPSTAGRSGRRRHHHCGGSVRLEAPGPLHRDPPWSVTRTATLPKPGHSSALMPVSGLFEIPIFDSTYAREATAAPTSLGREGRGTEGQTGGRCLF